VGKPLRKGEDEVIADLDFIAIDKRKLVMDSRGHYSRPEFHSLLIDRTPTAYIHDRAVRPMSTDDQGMREFNMDARRDRLSAAAW
jgi:aliphatic nitrilase